MFTIIDRKERDLGGGGKIAQGRKEGSSCNSSPLPLFFPSRGRERKDQIDITGALGGGGGAFAARENLLSEKRCDIRDFFSFWAELHFAVPVIDRQLGCGNQFLPPARNR